MYSQATSLVYVSLEYTQWTTKSGFNRPAVEAVINYVLANYDTKTHHECFNFQASGSHLDLGCAPYGLYGVKYIDLVSLARTRTASILGYMLDLSFCYITCAAGVVTVYWPSNPRQ